MESSEYNWANISDTNINHMGLHRTANEYAEERGIYKDLISKNKTPEDTWYDVILWVLGVLGQG